MTGKEKITVSLIQYNIKWEDKLFNLSRLDTIFNTISKTDLIVLPEMFATGFTMNIKDTTESMDGLTVRWMQKNAQTKNAAIAGSLIISENGQTFNRLVVALPDGKLFSYDKRHLFRMGEEHLYFSRGNRRAIVDYMEWKINALVCYDLRFPVWSRNLNDYDLLIYIANWPAARRNVWLKLLQARAIENQCYVVGVNRIGFDGNKLAHCGDSLCVDYKGNILTCALQDTEMIIYAELDLIALHQFRNSFPVWKDTDTFEIK